MSLRGYDAWLEGPATRGEEYLPGDEDLIGCVIILDPDFDPAMGGVVDEDGEVYDDPSAWGRIQNVSYEDDQDEDGWSTETVYEVRLANGRHTFVSHSDDITILA